MVWLRLPKYGGHDCRGHARVPQAYGYYHTLWIDDIYERYKEIVGPRPLRERGAAKVGTIARQKASNPHNVRRQNRRIL